MEETKKNGTNVDPEVENQQGQQAEGKERIEGNFDANATDVPQYIKAVKEITENQIQPLQKQDEEGRGLIQIIVQENVKTEDGEPGYGTSFAVLGSTETLEKGLYHFLTNKDMQDVVNRVMLRLHLEKLADSTDRLLGHLSELGKELKKRERAEKKQKKTTNKK